MKKILKILLFGTILFLIILIIPGKHNKTTNVCFESKKLSYNSFKKISYFPEILLAVTWFYKFDKGIWEIASYSNFIQTMQILIKNKSINKKITFIEGTHAIEIEKIINQNSNLTGKFVKIEEGSIFPDTYHFIPGTSRKKIIAMAKNNRRLKLNKLFAQYNSTLSEKDLIILASIVQKESNKKEEMIQIAGCFLNRLKKRMHLNSCATVFYGLNKIEARIPKATFKEIAIITPYNTYKKYGLPIGPICMPGYDAIEAVLIAMNQKCEYYYFCYNTNGELCLSKNLKEHIGKKNK